MKQKEIFIVHKCDQNEFELNVNACLMQGYQILSTSSGIVNSDAYNFTPFFIAIMVKYEDESQQSEKPVSQLLKEVWD